MYFSAEEGQQIRNAIVRLIRKHIGQGAYALVFLGDYVSSLDGVSETIFCIIELDWQFSSVPLDCLNELKKLMEKWLPDFQIDLSVGIQNKNGQESVIYIDANKEEDEQFRIFRTC